MLSFSEKMRYNHNFFFSCCICLLVTWKKVFLKKMPKSLSKTPYLSGSLFGKNCDFFNIRKTWKIEFCVQRGKKVPKSIFFLITKICIETINLAYFHIYMSFFEKITNFSIFSHFVLDNVENGRFCSTITQKGLRKSKNMSLVTLKFFKNNRK